MPPTRFRSLDGYVEKAKAGPFLILPLNSVDMSNQRPTASF